MDTMDFINNPVIINTQQSRVSDDTHAALPGQQITNIQVPTEQQWCLIPLYQNSQTTDSVGGAKMRFWQIGFDGNDQLVTVYGYVDSDKPTYNSRTIEPKVNRTMQEQALQEARIKYLNKYREGSRPAGEYYSNIEPQLANKYHAPGSLNDNNKLLSMNCEKFPVIIQGKIDGIRAFTYLKGDRIIIESRKSIEFQYLYPIRKELNDLFMYLPPGTAIDTELYRHGWSMETISSIVRTVKIEHHLNKYMKAYIFDIVLPYPASAEQRYATLLQALLNYYNDGYESQAFEVLTPIVVHSHQDLSDALYHFTEELDFEGIMIRHVAGTNCFIQQVDPATYKNNKELKEMKKQFDKSTYKGKRNNNLLKMKKWIYDEAEIVDVIGGEGREQGLALFQVKYKGQNYTVRPQEGFEYRKYWYENPHIVRGLEYTIKYFEDTAYGNPRFPVGVAFRLDF